MRIKKSLLLLLLVYLKSIPASSSSGTEVESDDTIAYEEKVKCETCPTKWDTQSDLDTHREIHAKEEIHVCSICRFEDEEKSKVVAHSHQHHQQNTVVCEFSCIVCQVKFGQRSDLIEHYSLHYEEVRTFTKHLTFVIILLSSCAALILNTITLTFFFDRRFLLLVHKKIDKKKRTIAIYNIHIHTNTYKYIHTNIYKIKYK